ncbi:nickel/cobalt transporter [Lichenibacterium dinghuense]|uniref:nickel/cobalt transporter n=1 Tax=Lichenibacterium dinghuense TaxID=2895977 RepID=UPI001F20645B|nr:high frequency lysogenization protein HflD [Lichenibacterium sp. 6Y81]
MTLRRLAVPAVLAAAAAMMLAEPALAQARNPFSVGISEGGGPATGAMGWILAQQGWFERALSSAVRATRTDASALPWLAGLSFVYGVLHAAGPGHGKAVLASYMVANRRALRRGIALSFLAALLQAAVAVALVGVLSLLFHATATGMRDGAALIETVSYVGVAGLGLWLTWRKGAALALAWRERPRAAPDLFAPASPTLAFAGAESPPAARAYRLGAPSCAAHEAPAGRSAFACTAEAGAAPHLHGPNCGHFHAPDPATLGDGFSWRDAVSTVVAAGARPCSGAILVLVFALAQGVFAAGIVSTLVMALGTAITTAALAATAVLAKGVALRLAGSGAGRGALVARSLEFAAALLVLAVGLSLLLGVGPLQGLA